MSAVVLSRDESSGAGKTAVNTSHSPIRDGHQQEDGRDQKKHRRQRVDQIEHHEITPSLSRVAAISGRRVRRVRPNC